MRNLVDHVVQTLWSLDFLALWGLAVVKQRVDHHIVVQWVWNRVWLLLIRADDCLDSALSADLANDRWRWVVP